MTVFNTEYVAYIYNERGYYVNEFASRLDLSNDTVEQILRGTIDASGLRISTLVNMAGLLGIPLHTMFATPTTPDPDSITDTEGNTEGHVSFDTAADAEQLIASVYDTGRTAIVMSEIAHAFGWTMDRLRAAATEADRRLRPAGLTMSTSHSEITVMPVNDHVAAQKALTARRTYERGLSYTHYKAVHQVLSGQPVTVNKDKRQRLRTLGGLVNYGIATDIKAPTLTDAVMEAFPEPTGSD